MVAAMREAFGKYDAIVTPTLPTVAYPVGVAFDKAYPKFPGGPDLIAPGNLAGLPALTVPNGIADKELPSSIAFLGTAFGEAQLTLIGKKYQQMTTHHHLRPPLRAQKPTG
jgi:aspartyl-tRNA(Asn)/glutamyl-tRNA(Gln) amidotransferase subunit A